jgi:hypothetical protein
LTDDGILDLEPLWEAYPMELDRERLAQLEVRVEEQGGRLIEISQQLRDLDGKFDGKFEAFDTKLDGLRLEMMKQFRWIIGIMVTLAGLFAAFHR